MRACPPKADTRIIQAQLAASAGWDAARATLPDGEAVDDSLVAAILEEAAQFAHDALVPLNDAMDRLGCRIDAGRVRTAPGHREAWREFIANGWITLGQPLAHGGQPLPTAVWAAVESVFDRSNPAFAMLPVPSISAARLIAAWGTQAIQDRWLPRLVGGDCAATICISEPGAGSDVGRIRTLASPAGDGTWRVTGEKCWISFGDHDLAPQILHCLLARTPGSAPGSAGLSLFLVPSARDDGTPNGVVVRRIEEKMGLHGSPTCALGFEEAQAELLGSEGRGLAQMFVMIANMRLAVAIQGLGIASAATDVAIGYARERRQGGSGKSPALPIADHADVRRMLIEMHGEVETLRGLILALANQVDVAAGAADPAHAREAELIAQWLLPIVKTAGAHVGFDVASLGIQVLGGAGYTREWPLEQGLRDARVLSVFEGTTGIQALDLLDRRLVRDAGEGVAAFIARARSDGTADEAVPLHAALDRLERVSEHLRHAPRRAAEAGATAYLNLAILCAKGWIAARLVNIVGEGDEHVRLRAAGRYVLACIDDRSAALAGEATRGDAPLAQAAAMLFAA